MTSKDHFLAHMSDDRPVLASCADCGRELRAGDALCHGRATGVDTDDLMALDLEYRLTIAHRIGCDCAPYFARRREVLIPAVLEQAAKDGADPVDTFAAFARRVHDRHGGIALRRHAGRFAALMALVGEIPTPDEDTTQEAQR